MKLSVTKFILRMLDPEGERQRMQVRHLRCMAEANAEDLVRTITTSHEKIKTMVDDAREKNGKGEH